MAVAEEAAVNLTILLSFPHRDSAAGRGCRWNGGGDGPVRDCGQFGSTWLGLDGTVTEDEVCCNVNEPKTDNTAASK